MRSGIEYENLHLMNIPPIEDSNPVLLTLDFQSKVFLSLNICFLVWCVLRICVLLCVCVCVCVCVYVCVCV